MFYTGIYHPTEITDLKSEIGKFVGKEIPLQYGWRETKGPNKGRHFYTAVPFINCVAESDLKNLVNISRIKYEEIKDQLSRRTLFRQ
jgi:hypothetical protein